MKLKIRGTIGLALASFLVLAPITAAYADDGADVTIEETVTTTEESTVEEVSPPEETAAEEAPPQEFSPASDHLVADGNIEIVNATCQVGETITYVTPLNASYDPSSPPVPASYPYAYNIVLVPNEGTTPLVDSWNGTLTGPLDCSAEASVSIVPATCELGEQLMRDETVKATFLSGGTPDGTFGPGFYDLVAESDSGVFFSDGDNAAYFSGELAGPLDPSDPLCGGEEELIGEVGELLPWTAATNQPSYWEDFGPHEATCYVHSSDSSHGSITDGGKTVTLNAYGASWPGDHWELLVVKGGSVSNNVIVHPTAGVAYASPLNAGGQQSDVSHFIVCKGTTPDVEPVEVTPSLVFTPGTCQATGTVTPTASDDYTWEFSGPASARIVTFSAVGNVTLTQTVFGPYDVRQTDWNDPACQPEFTFVEQCTTDGLFVELSYTNNSKWDRWPDYSFTGDTKVPTDYGSGPTWNTVKVTPGETKVIWSYTFPEDYNGGTVDVWYQDILGAERDIDTAKVTVTLDTDCAEPLPNTSTSDNTDEVCVAPGDVEGGSASFSLTAGDEGLSTIVRFKSLGDGTGGTAETFYRLDGTTGAPGEIVDYEAVTLAPGDTYTTTVVALSAGDYRFTLTGGLSNSERRALQQGVSIVAVDCPPEEEEPPVVDDPPVKEEPTGLAYTGSGDVNGALGIGLMALIAGIGMMVFRRRPVRQ